MNIEMRVTGTDAIHLDSADDIAWHDQADVVIVGFGGAGAIAAIHSAEGGADVIAVDRFDGGGATAFSGGVVYAGDTEHQRAAGKEDTVEDMTRYLMMEVGDAVSEDTVRRYAGQSAANLEWLESHGVRFGSELFSDKATYPPEGKFLYYAGNEKVDSYAAVAKPAPRGHRTRGKGFTGHYLFAALRASAERLGVRLLVHSPAQRLVVDAGGTVVGVEILSLPENERAAHQKLYDRITPTTLFKEEKAERANAAALEIEREHGTYRLIRARHGVVLSTGGFAFNLSMLEQHAPVLAKNYKSLMRLGSIGDDGSAVRLDRSLGAETGLMDNIMVGRTLSPPPSFLDGVLVNERGERFANEAFYQGSLGKAIAGQPNGTAWLILPRAKYRRAYREILTGGLSSLIWFGAPALLNMLFGGTRKASSLAGLARALKLDKARLRATVERYNALAMSRHDDDFLKPREHLQPVPDGPVVALNSSLTNKYSFMAVFSLGGLRTDEETSAVIGADGEPIRGLYAAGRSAVGLSSNRYISGLSIGDALFSGRRAAAACLREKEAAHV